MVMGPDSAGAQSVPVCLSGSLGACAPGLFFITVLLRSLLVASERSKSQFVD